MTEEVLIKKCHVAEFKPSFLLSNEKKKIIRRSFIQLHEAFKGWNFFIDMLNLGIAKTILISIEVFEIPISLVKLHIFQTKKSLTHDQQKHHGRKHL